MFSSYNSYYYLVKFTLLTFLVSLLIYIMDFCTPLTQDRLHEYVTCVLTVPVLGLMLYCCCLEIPNSFLKEPRIFSLH